MCEIKENSMCEIEVDPDLDDLFFSMRIQLPGLWKNRITNDTLYAMAEEIGFVHDGCVTSLGFEYIELSKFV